MAQAEREAKDSSRQATLDRELKDTKPDFFVDKSVPGRPIIAVGAQRLWRDDLRELALRTLEKPNPIPALGRGKGILNDIDRYAEYNKMVHHGFPRVFHISNNPLARKE